MQNIDHSYTTPGSATRSEDRSEHSANRNCSTRKVTWRQLRDGARWVECTLTRMRSTADDLKARANNRDRATPRCKERSFPPSARCLTSTMIF
eukprot:5364154-Alexandrium_andersonii.AAC.1